MGKRLPREFVAPLDTCPRVRDRNDGVNKGACFSFGIVLLEIVTGTQPTAYEKFGGSRNLVGWVMESFRDCPLHLVNPVLLDQGSLSPQVKKQMTLLSRVRLLCTREDPKSSPFMTDVLEMLEQMKNVESETVAQRTVDDLANQISVRTASGSPGCLSDAPSGVISSN